MATRNAERINISKRTPKEHFENIAREIERIEREHLRSLTLEQAISDMEMLLCTGFPMEPEVHWLKDKNSSPVSLKKLYEEAREKRMVTE